MTRQPTSFYCSDHHFHHANLLNFSTWEGKPVRPFKDLDEMHSTIITNHNRVVRPDDKVFFLGDVVMRELAKGIDIVSKLNGRKHLILGNHDKPTQQAIDLYQQYFDKISSCYEADGFILSHIPVHEGELSRFGFNIHGHLHSVVLPDWRYINVSMECINYTPVSIFDIRAAMDYQRSTHKIYKFQNQYTNEVEKRFFSAVENPPKPTEALKEVIKKFGKHITS